MATKPTNKMPQDLLLDRFAAIETALVETRATELRKREAALQANRVSAGWAVYARSADYQALLETRQTDLTKELETLTAPEVDESLAAVKNVSTPPQSGYARVFGRISGVDTTGMAVALIKDGGGVLASANPNSLGQYVIDTPCVEKQVTLEIHDANGRLLLQDGKSIELREGRAVLRNYSLNRCGDLLPDPGDGEQPALRMPDLIGKPVDVAAAEVKGLGDLELEITEAFDDAQKGLVVAQSPDGGTVLAQGDAIRLTVSLGPEPADKMPNLVEKPIDVARGELADFSFAALTIDYVDAPNDIGKVVKQEPEPDAPLGSDTKILLCIGQAPKTMPDLIGLTESVARAKIVPALADKIDVAYVDANAQPGIIVGQSPDAGAILFAGIGISVKVSRPVDESDLRMPNLIGVSEGQAKEALIPKYAEEIAIKYAESDKKAGTVIKQVPKAGTAIKPGRKITLEIARLRPEDEQVRMPNLKGLTAARAKKAMSELGITEVDYDAAESRRRGYHVTRQSPKAGQVLKGDETVTLVFGKTT